MTRLVEFKQLPDAEMIARTARCSVWRASVPRDMGYQCRYAVAVTDDEVLTFTAGDLRQLAETVQGLDVSGELRDTTNKQDYEAALQARQAEREARRPKPLW